MDKEERVIRGLFFLVAAARLWQRSQARVRGKIELAKRPRVAGYRNSVRGTYDGITDVQNSE